MPVPGICGGQQLLNVVLGGTLIQHIPDEVDGALAHDPPHPRTEPGHTVSVAPATLPALKSSQPAAWYGALVSSASSATESG